MRANCETGTQAADTATLISTRSAPRPGSTHTLAEDETRRARGLLSIGPGVGIWVSPFRDVCVYAFCRDREREWAPFEACVCVSSPERKGIPVRAPTQTRSMASSGPVQLINLPSAWPGIATKKAQDDSVSLRVGRDVITGRSLWLLFFPFCAGCLVVAIDPVGSGPN